MDYIIEEYCENSVNDHKPDYGSKETNAFTYNIIGACMEVYNNIGKGFSEPVYQDCLCIEFDQRNISYQREKKFEIVYKGIKIPHYYFADFIIEEDVILDTKATSGLAEDNIKQLINYLAASKRKIGLLVNFGENSLKYKRVSLTK